MGDNRILVWSESHVLTDYGVHIHPNRQNDRLTIVEYSIGDDEPWLESEEMIDFDKALQYVWPDENAAAEILEHSWENHTEILKKG